MTLLAPIPALIALAVTLPVLIGLYLLKLRRRPMTISSTLLWEQAAHDVQVNVPLRWIPPSLLLLLHALILLLFLVALARPAIEGSSAAVARCFLLVDCSATMSATDGVGGQSRLDAAKEDAVAFARDLLSSSGQVSVSVVSFAHEAAVVGRPVMTLGEVRAALAMIEPTDQPGRMAPALRMIETLLQHSAQEESLDESPLVVVFSDGGSNDEGPLAIAGARVSFSPVKTARDAIDNVAIVSCSAIRSDEDPASVTLFVQLQSTTMESITVPVSLLLDGREVAQHAMRVPAASREEPAQTGQSFRLRVPGNGLITVLLGRTDALETDNAASVYLMSPTRPRVLLVHPDARAGNPFLVDALGELPLRSLRVIPESQFEAFAASGADAFDLVVFEGVARRTLGGIPTLLFGEPRDGVAMRNGGFVLSWDRRSPVLRHVALDAIQVGRWAGPPDAEELARVGRVSDIALLSDGPAMQVVEGSGGRHLVVSFGLEQSNWPLHHSFPIFLFNAVEFLTDAERGRTSTSWSTTEPVIVGTRGTRGDVRVQGPINVQLSRPEHAGPMSVGVLPKAGVYRVEGADVPVLAVNMFDARESRLDRRERLTISGVEAVPLDEVQGLREIWMWFVAAAGVLLIIEWFVYAVRVRL